mmetsp:Transcript_5712/g.10359  ORF Transcript_5712/g.10359 Transcript_5712/m.10359 type:complete len:222 (+) Transcript_5712:141-806(+)
MGLLMESLGVSIPRSAVKASTTATFLGISYFLIPARAFLVSMRSRSLTAGSSQISASVAAPATALLAASASGVLASSAHFLTCSTSGTMSATLKTSLSPWRIACVTKGFRQSVSSRGAGATYLPFSSLYCSLCLPVMETLPYGSPAALVARSPVLNQRIPSSSRMTSSVASSLFQYPCMMWLPATQSSPSVPSGTSDPSSMLLTLHLVPGSGTPHPPLTCL